MIAAVMSAEWLKLRRSWLLALTFALAAIGPALVGAATWSARALERTELPLPLPEIDITWAGFLGPGLGFSSLFVLLALTLATAYLFGSEFHNDTVEITLAGSVRTGQLIAGRLGVLLAWASGLATLAFVLSVLIGAGIGLGAVGLAELAHALWLQTVRLAEILAGLPLIAWVAIRSRGTIVPVATGLLAGSTALLLRSGPVLLPVPWSMGAILSASGTLWSTLAAPVLVFGAGVTLCLVDMRNRDMV